MASATVFGMLNARAGKFYASPSLHTTKYRVKYGINSYMVPTPINDIYKVQNSEIIFFIQKNII